MRRDPTQFRERFKRWKRGLPAYEGGIPAQYDDDKTEEYPEQVLKKLTTDFVGNELPLYSLYRILGATHKTAINFVKDHNNIAPNLHYVYGGSLPEVVIKPDPNSETTATLTTYYPWSKKYPITGHSELETAGGNFITATGNDPWYNFVTNNCSDATRRALEKATGKKINPYFFTTPGDVKTFAEKELGGKTFNNGDGSVTTIIKIPTKLARKIALFSEELNRLRFKPKNNLYEQFPKHSSALNKTDYKMPKYEGGIPAAYNEFVNTLPKNQKPVPDYNTYRYWLLNGKPKSFTDAIAQGMYMFENDGFWHAGSIAYNEDNDTYEFMKPNNHPTRWMETGLDKEFFDNYRLEHNGPREYDRYVPRVKPGLKVNRTLFPKFEIGTVAKKGVLQSKETEEKDGENKSISFWDIIRYNTKELKRKLEVNNHINSQKQNLPPSTEDTTPKYKITDIFNPVSFAIKTNKKLINKIVYNAYSGSGGQPNIPAILEGGSKYTGSYIYPARSSYKTGRLLPDQSEDNKNLGSVSTYGGDNADTTRDLVALSLGIPANVKKLRYGTYNVGDILHTGFIYEGKIYPKTFAGDTYLIPKQVKPQFDSLILNDRNYLVNMNQLPVDRSRYPLQTIDNVRHARLKPQKDNSGNYFLKATKLWDMSSPNIGTLGSIADFFTKFSGGNKFVLEQTIPVLFVDSVDTRDWHTIRNTFINHNKKSLLN